MVRPAPLQRRMRRSRTMALQVNEQGGDIRGVDPADPTRLAERAGPDSPELFPGLGAKLGDRVVVEVGRKRLVFQPSESFHLVGLCRM